ncbi:MAG: hypothetical protein AAF511_01135, partial [Pseudomonadota bacterium]
MVAKFVDDILKAPTLQHAVKRIGESPLETAENILSAEQTKFAIATWRVRDFIEYALKYFTNVGTDGTVQQRAREAIESALANARQNSNKHIRKAAEEILPLIERLIVEHDLRWFQPCGSIEIRLSKRVKTRANPLGIARFGDEVVVLWPQTWKRDSLIAFQFNLLITILHRKFIDERPEISGVMWVELSAPTASNERELSVRTSEAAAQLSTDDLDKVSADLEKALLLIEKKTGETRR